MSRILFYFSIFFVVLGLNFFLPRLLPGDPLTALTGDSELVLTPGFRQELLHRYGLDQPLATQFRQYLANLARGDLGYSFHYQAPVSRIIGPALLWTAILCGVSFVVSLGLGFFLGVELAWQRQRYWTAAAVGGCLVLEALPGFLLGMFLLMIFSLKLGLFPFFGAVDFSELSGGAGGAGSNLLRHLTLPALTLVLGEAPGIGLLVRSSALKHIRAPFIVAARSRGLGEVRIKYRYLARNALLPLITRLGLRFGFLWAGALPVEVVFAYPGAGQLLFQALMKRDYPLLQGLLLVSTLAVLVGNALAEWGYRLADPRVRDQG
jgi:peptide/nickel transport system permease protein